MRTKEPAPLGEKRVKVASPAQPLMLLGYKRPDQYSKDAAVLDVLAEVFTGARTGILYKELVRGRQIALAAESIATFPGGKYPSLFAFFLVPSLGHTLEENEKALYEIIERVKNTPQDKATLDRIKTKLRAAVIQTLDNNSGLAETLARYQAAYGDWRRLFTELDDYNKVTAEDVRRVAREYLVENARTVSTTFAPQGGGR